LFLELIDALSDAALIVDDAGIVVLSNGLAFDALQLKADGLPIGSVLRSEVVTDGLKQARETNALITVAYESRGAIARQFGVHMAPIGRSGKILVQLRDFTREQAIEKMRSDFVANASHEMRTPLASIIGGIETIRGAAKDDARARDQFLDTMLMQAQRMKRLLDDLLTLSRIEIDEHVAPNDVVNLADVARQSIGLLRPIAKETDCKLEVDELPRLMVRGDPSQLSQVVNNLLENAIKYSGRGKTIVLTGSVRGKMVALSIKDEGPGIAAHHIPRLTERFYRVNVQDSRMRGGTGLGLAICKHIVSRHRGRLIVESEVGKGSVFSIQFPSATQ
jgi:two-component system phosphate regulon sensor histidine kinase PhoR